MCQIDYIVATLVCLVCIADLILTLESVQIYLPLLSSGGTVWPEWSEISRCTIEVSMSFNSVWQTLFATLKVIQNMVAIA